MYRTLVAGLFAIGTATASASGPGMIVVDSAHDVATTADRLESVLQDKGMKVFARIDHAAGAGTVDMELPPTTLLIFGNPKVGTPLMQCNRTVAIDLPQKVLIWETKDGATHLAYNDPDYLAQRHTLDGCTAIIQKVKGALAKFTAAATQP